MTHYTHTLHPDELFSQQTKTLFLQIPHKVININPNVDLIDFDVPENGQYPLLTRNTMINIKAPLSKEDDVNFEIRQHLHASLYEYGEDDTGLFIKSNHGSSIENFIKELYKHDKSSGQGLLDSYHQLATTCSDVVSIEEKFVRQLEQLREHLIKEKLDVADYEFDYQSYSQKTKTEQINIVNDLYKKYGDGYYFPAYNDLDYTPFTSNGDIYMYDSSGARLYIIKTDNDSQKIYMINKQDIEFDNIINDFAYSHNQIYLLMGKKISNADLIGEIKDGKIIKASLELTNYNLMQSFILKTLYQEGKVKNIIPKLTFEELLNNYTLQKEIYQIKERAFIKIFQHLQLSDNTLTYADFSVVKENPTLKIKHEDFSVHTVQDLQQRLQTKDNIKISQLPPEYKDQIRDYLTHLVVLYNNETTHLISQFIIEQMDAVAPKLKRK